MLLIVVFALTQYRTSPFKNSRVLLRRVSARYKDNSISSNDERKKLYRWVSVVNSQRRRATSFFSLVDLHVALHGFIVFEVCWDDIRGINYFSELQVHGSSHPFRCVVAYYLFINTKFSSSLTIANRQIYQWLLK